MEKFLELFAVFIRNHTNVSTNIQDKFLISAIREALDIDLQETIGTKLYEELIRITENEAEIRENEMFMDLLTYTKYFVAYITVARLAVISSVKIDNIGLNKTSDEHVESLDMSDVFSIEDHYYNKADVYKNRLQKFICANKSYFKEWLSNTKLDEIKENLYSTATSSIWLGGARGKKYIKK